jgi:hypothetical protein
MTHAASFQVGQFVESTDEHDYPFVGTVMGLSVNSFGEPILVCHMIARKFSEHRSMLNLGFTPVENTAVGDDYDEFYERTGVIHPCRVRPLAEGTYLTKKTKA